MSRPPADLHSSLLHRSSASSLPSSSFPIDHDHLQPRHHGPSYPAPPPSQTSRPPSLGRGVCSGNLQPFTCMSAPPAIDSVLLLQCRTPAGSVFLASGSNCSSPFPSGSGPSVRQQFLVVPDGNQGVHGVVPSYATLPRVPRRAPPPSSLPRPQGCSGAALPPRGAYATLSHPRSSTGLTAEMSSRYRHPPPTAPHQLRVGREAPTQPLRLDMPPDSDWRRDTNYRTVRPRAHLRLCCLCQQLPAEPSRSYCLSCGAYVARFRPAS